MIRPRGTRSTESEECPDPTKIFDTECIVETFRAGRGWMAIHHKDPAWWRSFKLLVKEYILKTRFYNTMPAMHSTTEQVTAKLDALIPAAFDAKHFSHTFKETVCNVQQLDHRKLMKPYSDGWESWSCSTFSPGRS